MKFDKKEFANEPINLNGNHFENCTFTKCEMIFTGVGPVGLVGCGFIECRWSFQGPASDTVAFMKALYDMGGGGKALIEATFKQIVPDVRFKH